MICSYKGRTVLHAAAQCAGRLRLLQARPRLRSGNSFLKVLNDYDCVACFSVLSVSIKEFVKQKLTILLEHTVPERYNAQILSCDDDHSCSQKYVTKVSK